MKHGEGEIRYRNGNVLTGSFKNNKAKGHGVMKYANGRLANVYNGKTKMLFRGCLVAVGTVIIALTIEGIIG